MKKITSEKNLVFNFPKEYKVERGYKMIVKPKSLLY